MMAPPDLSRPLPTQGPVVNRDEMDDLFDYDIGGENDPFSENYQAPASKEKQKENSGKGGASLGIDEEVEVTRKPRAPRVKLDEHRLLSAAGIPKLRKRAKDLKFKGRGHEYSDASRLLTFYQLWLDDLFPKARFLDALAMVEKAGHKKMMHAARLEWINEGKPKSSVHEDSLFDEPELPAQKSGDREPTVSRVAPIFENSAPERSRPMTPREGMADDDIYDATPAQSSREAVGEGPLNSVVGGGRSLFGPGRAAAVDSISDEDMDALEAMLADEQAHTTSGKPKPSSDEMIDDDLDALLAEEESFQAGGKTGRAASTVRAEPDDDLDALDALLAEEEALKNTAGNVRPVAAAKKVVTEADNFDDDMEAMAEMEGMW